MLPKLFKVFGISNMKWNIFYDLWEIFTVYYFERFIVYCQNDSSNNENSAELEHFQSETFLSRFDTWNERTKNSITDTLTNFKIENKFIIIFHKSD